MKRIKSIPIEDIHQTNPKQQKDDLAIMEDKPQVVNLLFKNSCSDVCKVYSVPYDMKLWKVVQQCASEIGITFLDNIRDNRFRVLINGLYPRWREALNSTPEELHLKNGDIVIVDDDKTFNEWAMNHPVDHLTYTHHNPDYINLDESKDEPIYIMTVNAVSYNNEPHEKRCPLFVFPENNLMELFNCIKHKLDFRHSFERYYFSHDNGNFRDADTTVAEMGIKNGDILFVSRESYCIHHFEFIHPEDDVD